VLEADGGRNVVVARGFVVLSSLWFFSANGAFAAVVFGSEFHTKKWLNSLLQKRADMNLDILTANTRPKKQSAPRDSP